MTFFFDRCVSKKIVDALKCLGIDAIHLDSVFGRGVKVEDREWIVTCGLMGWVAITCDCWIFKNAPELEAVRRARIVSVFIAESFSNLSGWDKYLWLINNWQKITASAEGAGAGTILHMAKTGDLSLLEDGEWAKAKLPQPRAQRSRSW
ncbi:MAG: hypothetical protein KKI08_15065 [Armatimonadetes bacterium]|nr:hypothetical protein [Armatimonadota bacterium]